MSKKDAKGKGVEEKLDPDEDIKHENFKLAVNKEEIQSRLRILNDEKKKILRKYEELIQENKDLQDEFETHKEQAMVKRNKHKGKKLDLANKIKGLERAIDDQKLDFQEQLEEQASDYDGKISQLNKTIEVMNAKIEEAEKFIKEKNRYLQDIADLKTDLV